jgi:hypothetical protein
VRAPGDSATTTRSLSPGRVQRADEVRDEGRGRTLVDLPRACDLLDPPAVHHRDPVGHRERLFLVVRHVHERRAQLVLDPLQLELHLLSELDVERPERLVQEQGCGSVHERPRERDALLLAARELTGATAFEALERNDAEDLVDPLAVLAPRDALDLEAERDVVVDRHVWKERVLLEHHVDRAPVGRHARHVLPLQNDAARVRHLEPGDHPQGGRLAATARAEQREELALGDRERDVVDRPDPVEALADTVKGDSHTWRLGHDVRV